jgi:transposase
VYWHLLGPRLGAPWRDLPEAFGPYTTCYNRFVRWWRAGVWGHINSGFSPFHGPAEHEFTTWQSQRSAIRRTAKVYVYQPYLDRIV